MRPQFFTHPVPYLVIDDFLSDFDSVSSLAESLYYLTDLGSHGTHKADPVTKRNEFYLYSMSKDPGVAEMIKVMNSHFWSEETRKVYDEAPYPYPMLNSTSYDGMLLGFYGEGGFYKMHKDTSFVTSLVFLHKEKRFEGGDFILSNKTEPYMNRKFDSVTIEAKPNRAVFFPSCFYHGVSDIKTPDKAVSSMRISYANFLGFDNA
jgi:Rps23 Pro-64 3,4-dihydroxylase Tpa1-like proline 4-hydroxylase